MENFAKKHGQGQIGLQICDGFQHRRIRKLRSLEDEIIIDDVDEDTIIVDETDEEETSMEGEDISLETDDDEFLIIEEDKE